jgi:hypothetical protein
MTQENLTMALGVFALLGPGGLGLLLWRLQARFHDLEMKVAVIQKTGIDDKTLQPLLNHVIATIGAKVDKIEQLARESSERMAEKVGAIALTVAALAAREGTIDYTALNQKTLERARRGS